MEAIIAKAKRNNRLNNVLIFINKSNKRQSKMCKSVRLRKKLSRNNNKSAIHLRFAIQSNRIILQRH